MNSSTTYKTISECAAAFPGVTESSLRRWIKSGKIPQDALLITESEHKAGRMVTLIDTEALKKILLETQKRNAPKEAVPSIGTNQVAGTWEQIKRPYEDFIAYLKDEVEAQRLRAEEAEERAKKAEKQIRLLTHQPPSESKVEAKGNESKKADFGDVMIYAAMVVVVSVLGVLLMQQFKYSF